MWSTSVLLPAIIYARGIPRRGVVFMKQYRWNSDARVFELARTVVEKFMPYARFGSHIDLLLGYTVRLSGV